MAFLNPRRDSNDKEIAMLQDCCSVYSKLHSQHVSAKMVYKRVALLRRWLVPLFFSVARFRVSFIDRCVRVLLLYTMDFSSRDCTEQTWSPPQQEISAPTVQILGSKFIADDVARQVCGRQHLYVCGGPLVVSVLADDFSQLTYLEQRLLRAVRPREVAQQYMIVSTASK